MPSEPEKKIEPLLEAYATRRRQAADPGAAMPAGLRRRLQSEVRQRWARPSRGTDIPRRWHQILTALWPRLATAGGILAVLAAGLWWLSPPRPDQNLASAPAVPSIESNVKPGASLAEVSSRFEPAAAPALLPPTAANTPILGGTAPSASVDVVVLTATTPDAPAAPTVPTPALVPAPSSAGVPLAGESLPKLARPDERLADHTQSGLAGRPLALSSRTAEEAAPLRMAASQTVTTQKSAEFQRFAVTSPLLQPTAGSTVAPAPPAPLIVSTADGRSQSFFRNVPPTVPGASRPGRTSFAQRRGDDAARRPTSNQVLESFALEQHGSTVRLIDADGSIYEGRIMPAAGKPLESVVRRYDADRRDSARPVALAEAERREVQSELAFEVTGTNATLRQPVYVAGTLLLDSTNALFTTGVGALGLAPIPVAKTESGVRALGPVTGPESSDVGRASQVLRIQGRGRFGVSNDLRIDAVPTGPR